MLVSLARYSTVMAGLAQRARIVLLAADGVSNTEIASRTGVLGYNPQTLKAYAEASAATYGGCVARNLD